jgi:hypothetical protein
MKQIQMQFNSNEVDDYIERYILTKHPRTTNIISKCIKHAADIKLVVFQKEHLDDDEPNQLITEYSAYLMYLCCVEGGRKPVVEYIQNQNQLSGFAEKVNGLGLGSGSNRVLEIPEKIIDQIPDQHKNQYRIDIETVLSHSTYETDAQRYFVSTPLRLVNPRTPTATLSLRLRCSSQSI